MREAAGLNRIRVQESPISVAAPQRTRSGGYVKITFVSNYINHHQIPFCQALYERLGEDFTFIQTEPMEEERIRMGWAVDAKTCPYVRLFYEKEELCRSLIEACDLLLAGWMEDVSLITKRLGDDRPVLRISERIYREGQWRAVSPRGLAAKWKEHIRYRKKPVYLLCAGAYVASDFALIGAYPGKKLRFGYFPQTRRYAQSPEGPLALKSPEGPLQLLWAGRLMRLKHPEYVVRLAAELCRRGYDFHIHLIGSGEMEEALKGEIHEQRLENCVSLHGFLPPEQVREYMERSHIYLFTSNHLEGWGAVVNEAMNSGCAVVGSACAGAVPTLIRHGENGMIYHHDSYEEFQKAVCFLMEHGQERAAMGRRAWETILTEWNAENAARRCLDFYEGWKAGKPVWQGSGPLSPAPVIRPEQGRPGRYERV